MKNTDKTYYSTHKKERKIYVLANKERRDIYIRGYNLEHADELKNYKKKYRLENKNKIKEGNKKYYWENKEKWQDYHKIYYRENKKRLSDNTAIYNKTPRGKAVMAKRQAKRKRELGYNALNAWFEGADGHHIGREYVIYIPKELHRSIKHSVLKNINMKSINAVALDYLFTTATIKKG